MFTLLDAIILPSLSHIKFDPDKSDTHTPKYTEFCVLCFVHSVAMVRSLGFLFRLLSL